MGIKQYHLLISGRVQGVSYRASAWEKAQQLGIHGWVKNLPDGRVEMVIAGEQVTLEQMISWAEQGPQFADVSHIDISEQSAINTQSEFQIR